MILLVVVALSLGLTVDSDGMPPFVILSPPYLKAGHTTIINIALFTEVSGSLTLTYLNYTRQWYPQRSYTENILERSTTELFDQKLINLPVQVPDQIVGTHILRFSGSIDGYGDFELYDQTLRITRGGYKTYVQTDKPIYKPGQPVRFRGFSVDSDLMWLELPDGLKVTITNPGGIKVFDETVTAQTKISPIHGGEFLLADEAQLGVYRITVTGRNSATCSFSVEEYVLPKFGMEIEGPGHINAEDDMIKGSVTATYTYGIPVSGELKMTFAIDNQQQTMYQGPYHLQELTMDFVDGKAYWEISITDLVKPRLRYLFDPWCSPSKLVIHARLTDAARGFEVEKTDSSTNFVQSSLKLTFSKSTQKNYVAGFPYYVELDVAALGISISNDIPVKLTMITGVAELKYTSIMVQVFDGKAFTVFDVPENACAVKITAEILIDSACDAIFACFQPERFVAKGDEYIRFVQEGPVVYSAGEAVHLRMISNKEPAVVHFVMLSKGSIAKSWTTTLNWIVDVSGKYTSQIDLTVPSYINTKSRMLALSANSDTGFILADAIDICFTETLWHKLQLQFLETTGKPGDKVELAIMSDANSFIGLSVTDVSLNLLREPCKVLTEDGTLSFLRGLDSGTDKDLSCKRDDPYQCKSSTKVKIIDINDLLSSEGLQITTNMNLFSYAAPVDDSYPVYGYKDDSSRYEYRPAFDEMPLPAAAQNSNVELDEGSASDSRLRNVFPESWLWADQISSGDGTTIMSVTAPDTITSWVGYAFGLSHDKGLGFSNEATFRTFLPFFISLDLPYSGKVGERITVPIRVFNYRDTEIVADIVIKSKLWEEKRENVGVIEPGKAATVDYTITLTEAGNHEIRVEASSSQGESDAIEKSLFVQPGGEKITESSSLLIMAKKRSSKKTVIEVALPVTYIPGSHSLKLVAVGDILGEAVSGISNLIQLPSGSGEQNMHKIAINVFSANYLESLYNVLPLNIDYNIKLNLNIGLQQQLAYRKGSIYISAGYSLFVGGETSDWLTAFVYKIASQFPKSIFLPCGTAINKDREYLLNNVALYSYTNEEVLAADAERVGWAPYQYSYLSSKDVYWNAYYLIALLESEGKNRCGYSFFSQSSYNDKTKVEQVCYATMMGYLSAGDCCYHHMVVYALGLCQKYSLVDPGKLLIGYDDSTCLGTSLNKRFKFATCQENLQYENAIASSKSIEATGYAVLYLISKGEFSNKPGSQDDSQGNVNLKKSLPLIMWLASQRKESGGFRSSQDTVIGLQALAKFAERSNADMSEVTDLDVTISRGRKSSRKIIINNENRLSVMELLLTPAIGKYKLKWKGIGVAFVQLVSTYHVTASQYESVFSLSAIPSTTPNDLPMVTVSFSLPEEGRSTMYLLEVGAVTGSVFTKVFIEEQFQSGESGFEADVIARYDIKEGGQRLQLYLNPSLKKTEFTLSIPMDVEHPVENSMPAQVSMVDYYTPSIRETVFYNVESDVTPTDEDEVDA